MTMGEPIMAVMALTGNTVWLPGTCEMMSQTSIKIPPINAEVGTNMRWSDVFRKLRERCGTAMPTKPIGPQKPVIAPAKILVVPIMATLAHFTFKPILWA